MLEEDQISDVPVDGAARSASYLKASLATHDKPERDRLEFWQSTVTRTFNADFRPAPDAPVFAEAQRLRLNHFSVSRFASSQGCYELHRNALHLAEDRMKITLVRRGHTRLTQRGQELILGPGEAGATLTSECSRIDFLEADTAVYCVSFPLTPIAAAIKDLSKTLVRRFGVGTATMRMLTHYASVLTQIDSPVPQDFAGLASRHMAELVTAALRELEDPVPLSYRSGLRASRKRDIKHDILAHIGESSLSCEGVAARLGITGRYLRRLLREDGTNFTDFVRNLRLEKAHQLLCDPAQIGRKVLSIAIESGFNDLSYFNRLYRQVYGLPPSKMRHQHLIRQSTTPGSV